MMTDNSELNRNWTEQLHNDLLHTLVQTIDASQETGTGIKALHDVVTGTDPRNGDKLTITVDIAVTVGREAAPVAGDAAENVLPFKPKEASHD